MLKQIIYVSNTVSDEDIRQAFEDMFNDVGNNAVERIEVEGDNKIIHITDTVYCASLESPDDFYKFFDYQEILTMGLYDGHWVIGVPSDFEETRYFKVHRR